MSLYDPLQTNSPAHTVRSRDRRDVLEEDQAICFRYMPDETSGGVVCFGRQEYNH